MFLAFLSGEDAYKKIRAGATLVQLYTGFAYGGPALIPQIKVLLNDHLMCCCVKKVSGEINCPLWI